MSAGRTRGRRDRDERGYVAVMTAALVAVVFLPLCALALDTARWYVEIERVQNAADAAALAGVTFLPDDLGSAESTAIETAARNGYPVSDDTRITVATGERPSQLRVTVSTRVSNAFASLFGVPATWVSRSAVADYTAPAPMGSPCNTFGNEPPSQQNSALPVGTALPSGSARFPNCSSDPQFWAAVEGPATDKVQGDRYLTTPCAGTTTYGCENGVNTEAKPEGYFFAVHVEPEAVGTSINVQVYDPAYVETGVDCSAIDTRFVLDSMSSYTRTDGRARYRNRSSIYCSGDYNPGGTTGSRMTTTFLMREQTDSGNPLLAGVLPGCTRQFTGTATTPREALRQWTDAEGTSNYQGYNPELTRVFHQWVSLCSFVPQRSGDYYLQVRTNVAPGGQARTNRNASGASFAAVTYEGNPAAGARLGNTDVGVGLNAFAIRAVPATTALRTKVSVAGAGRMPILQNASSSTATFNLIRALPGAAGQYLAFNFFDAADGSTSEGGSVRVIPPVDATGTIKAAGGIPDCRGTINDGAFSALTGCRVNVRNSTHNGQVQRIRIPIPPDYNCNATTLGGCWFSVEISFSGSAVTDFTTWDANIGGDPVRLIE